MSTSLHGFDSLPPGQRPWRAPDLRLGEIASRFGDSASVRTRSLAALRASEKRYRELFETRSEPTATAPLDARPAGPLRLP
jgi:hypothetical protein